jgi:8-oxo-dGTP diphosphatase
VGSPVEEVAIGMQGGRRRLKTMRVVAALIRAEGQVLLTQRKPGRHLGLSWEFPGGKVEAGETDVEALERELREELGVAVRVGTLCYETRHNYGSREMHLLVYRARITEGKPQALDTYAAEWVHEQRLMEREFLPADMPLVHGIVQGLVAHEEDSGDDDDDEFSPATVVRPAE